jgi:molybdopterin-guanine dinucleotide biosynthesis protein A
MTFDPSKLCTVILAGGRGQRMGGLDKGLVEWRGKPLIEHVLAHIPARSKILISANRNQDMYARYGHPVIADKLPDFAGPLAGILSAMQYCDRDYLLCLPCDTPQPPQQLAERLMQCLHTHHARCAICHDGTRVQPLFALLSCSLQPALREFLQQQHKVMDFFAQQNAVVCDFSDQPRHFDNLNTPDDLA